MTVEQAEMFLYRLDEITVILGTLQGYAVFGIVVVLFYFAYKFLRMFF